MRQGIVARRGQEIQTKSTNDRRSIQLTAPELRRNRATRALNPRALELVSRSNDDRTAPRVEHDAVCGWANLGCGRPDELAATIRASLNGN